MRWNSHFAPAGILTALVFSLATLLAATGTKPLPEAVVRAHTIFLLNETNFHELEYSTVLELSKWGRFELVDSSEKADLILRLDNGNQVRALPEGQFPSAPKPGGVEESAVPPGHTRISLLDPKTKAMLWYDTHKTEGGKVKNGHLLDGLREAFDAYEKGRR